MQCISPLGINAGMHSILQMLRYMIPRPFPTLTKYNKGCRQDKCRSQVSSHHIPFISIRKLVMSSFRPGKQLVWAANCWNGFLLQEWQENTLNNILYIHTQAEIQIFIYIYCTPRWKLWINCSNLIFLLEYFRPSRTKYCQSASYYFWNITFQIKIYVYRFTDVIGFKDLNNMGNKYRNI